MTGPLSSVFPRPQSNDTDDVVWTLQTAAVQWQRGLRADAIVWVRRAADTSVQTGRLERAEELRDQAARLAEYLWTEPRDESGSSGMSNPQMPQHPQTLQELAALDELEEEAVLLDGYELEVKSRRPEQVSSLDVTDLTLDDLDEEVLDGELLDDDLELLEDENTPPDGVPQSFDIASPDSVLPESERAPRDSFMSVSPEEEDEELVDSVSSSAPNSVPIEARHSFSSISPDSDSESEPPQPSERPTLPHLEASNAVGSDPSYSMGAKLASAVRDSSTPPTLRRQRIDESAPSSISVIEASEKSEESPELEISASDPAALRAELLSTPPDESLDTALADALLEDLAAVELLEWQGATQATPTAVSSLSATPASARPASLQESEGPPQINGLALEDAEIVADLPEDAQRLLVATAEMHSIDGNESLLLEEGIALVTEGAIHVMLDGSEVSAARVGVGAVVAIDGSLGRQPLELVADASVPRIAVWPQDTLDAAMSDCPWVIDDLRVLADRFQAQAGAGQGEMGGRLDDALRSAVYERLEVRVLHAGEVVAEKGKALSGLFIVAGGQLLATFEDSTETLVAGQFVYAGCVIGADPSPADVVAGPNGALALFASRPVAHELMMSVPPLLEILAG